jgi:catechol 2,3-dioxygenase-like lactoylglutathione lyase family enzyme|tara:strand:+ start:3405 stop:3800 length:396 start_codon:yes stop_codon:yes gene_type:complete
MTFTVKGLDHLVLVVDDLELAVDFYVDVLGCRVERRVERIGLVQLRAGDSLIDLQQRKPDDALEGRNLDHFALRIEPFEAAALRAHLSDHGVAAGEVGERYGAQGTGPSLYLQDPEGNVIELKGPPRTAPS